MTMSFNMDRAEQNNRAVLSLAGDSIMLQKGAVKEVPGKQWRLPQKKRQPLLFCDMIKLP